MCLLLCFAWIDICFLMLGDLDLVIFIWFFFLWILTLIYTFFTTKNMSLS
ncbi:hypothetical protein AtNW77_Chr1g0074211 [Arabidopsis thaliana]